MFFFWLGDRIESNFISYSPFLPWQCSIIVHSIVFGWAMVLLSFDERLFPCDLLVRKDMAISHSMPYYTKYMSWLKPNKLHVSKRKKLTKLSTKQTKPVPESTERYLQHTVKNLSSYILNTQNNVNSSKN